MNHHPTYDIRRSYRWNYEHPPTTAPMPVVAWPGDWNCCGWPLSAPLAVAAGPLLNGAWLQYYANLGFDLLTYKTVRRQRHPSYAMPNLQPIESDRLVQEASTVVANSKMSGTWAVSFGMPSRPPDQWQADVTRTRDRLASDKGLSVSVVATPESDWNLDQVADDYAQCSQMAIKGGANMIELNLSCPNVSTCDGQLYRQPAAAAHVARRVREQIGETPMLLKIGHLAADRNVAELVDAVADLCDALVMVNCIAARVRDGSDWLFNGQPRGIAGVAIHEAAVRQLAQFRRYIERSSRSIQLVGCGGVSTRTDAQRFLDAGASCVQLATAVMLDPMVASTIRRQAANVRA